MDRSLGHFGDARLEKGGLIFWIGWCGGGVGGLACAGSVGIAQARYALRGGFGTPR